MKLAVTLTAIASVASQVASAAIGTSSLIAKTTTTAPNLLIFSKTVTYRHASIPQGIELVTSIAKDKNWTVEATEDASVFTTAGLSAYTTLVFVCTTGNILTSDESDALYHWLMKGGSWVGIHAAADYGDLMPSWYGRLVGGQFAYHPCSSLENCNDAQRALYPVDGNIRPDRINITDATHPSTRDLPTSVVRTDEWYTYKTNPSSSSNYTILAELQEEYIDSITPDILRMAGSHPIAWYSTFEEKARAWYTGMGHTAESYAEEYFINHLTGGLEWATGTTN